MRSVYIPAFQYLYNYVLVRRYTPRRALLYVPGDDLKKINKAFELKVDCIVLDCEDGVACNKKVRITSDFYRFGL